MSLKRHLRDNRLVECYLTQRAGEALDPLTAEHLADCVECHARYGRLAGLLDETKVEADAETDAVFPAERLRTQQLQIASRLAHIGHPARVLAFPTQLIRRAGAPRHHGATRWIAAAAVAGLVLGIGLGKYVDGGLFPARTRTVAVRQATAVPATRISAPLPVDDEFLSALEIALERPHTAELQPL